MCRQHVPIGGDRFGFGSQGYEVAERPSLNMVGGEPRCQDVRGNRVGVISVRIGVPARSRAHCGQRTVRPGSMQPPLALPTLRPIPARLPLRHAQPRGSQPLLRATPAGIRMNAAESDGGGLVPPHV